MNGSLSDLPAAQDYLHAGCNWLNLLKPGTELTDEAPSRLTP
jgi:hypothetical protein